MTINTRKISSTVRDLLTRVREGKAVQRLPMHVSRQKIPADYDSLGEFVGNGIPEPHVFLADTNFFTHHEIPPKFWLHLLTRRTAMTAAVFQELADWRNNPFCNAEMAPLVSAAGMDPPFILDQPFAWGMHRLKARQYYTTLLSSRKDRALEMHGEFTEREGRKPDRPDIDRILQKGASERDFHLMRKAIESQGRGNWWTDEDLVVCAAQIAVYSGSGVTILTRDRDVFDQFEKLCSLLISHYQAMLFGEKYASEAVTYRSRPMPIRDPVIDAFFHGDRSVLVEKPVPPDDFTAWLFPSECHPVQVCCVLLGGPQDALTLQVIEFTAEREMDRLMEIKGRTLGRSVELPEGLNVHVTGFPSVEPNPRQFIFVGVDKTLEGPGTDMQWAQLDYAHANYHFEIPVTCAEEQPNATIWTPERTIWTSER